MAADVAVSVLGSLRDARFLRSAGDVGAETFAGDFDLRDLNMMKADGEIWSWFGLDDS